MSEVPEINGKPAAKITVTVQEKVGLQNYSNVTYGTTTSRYVEDDPDSIKAARDEATTDVEGWLSDYFRSNVQALLEGGGK